MATPKESNKVADILLSTLPLSVCAHPHEAVKAHAAVIAILPRVEVSRWQVVEDVWVTSIPPRPMTLPERAVLKRLLSADFAGVEQLRAQVDTAVVIGRCDCGCPTIDLAVDGSVAAAEVERSLGPPELRDCSVDPPGEIILLVRDGYLRSLEYFSPNSRPPAAWPDAKLLVAL